MRLVSLLLLGLCGCFSSTPRFRDQPIVWRVDDDRNIPEPEEREYSSYQYMADVFLLRRSVRALELRDRDPALNTNALDEVPDSTWFTNRGVLSPELAAKGAEGKGPPLLPMVVASGKSSGGNEGFLAKDATGRKFLVKLDRPKNPEQQSAADAIVSRVFWALGYFVPADYVVHFSRDDLSLAGDAKISDRYGEKRSFEPADLDAILSRAPALPDGSYRALASEYLPGKPAGGILPEGVRSDDPNDTVPHESRRELRALKVFGAWVNHTDLKEDNFLDMYVDENGRKFLRHYLVDFGEALGGHAAEKDRIEDGYEHFWDWSAQMRALFSFGLWKRDWESLVSTKWASIGAFASEPFDPEGWREAYPFFPVMDADPTDTFWAVKTMLRIDRPQLAAIVAEGRLSDPGAEEYLLDTLMKRREKLAAVYLEKVSPLDEFVVSGHTLCAVDLALRHRLASIGVLELLDEEDAVTARFTADSSGRVCVPIETREEYVVYRMRVRRGGEARPPLQLHLKGSRILGLVRLEQK